MTLPLKVNEKEINKKSELIAIIVREHNKRKTIYNYRYFAGSSVQCNRICIFSNVQ